jgi:hypothetical protein
MAERGEGQNRPRPNPGTVRYLVATSSAVRWGCLYG